MDRELRRLLDHQEITDLIHDYCTYCDTLETEKLGDLFTEDCITDYGPAFGGERTGRKRLTQGAAITLSAWQATSHHVSNIRLHFEDDDHARGVTYLYAWHETPDDQPDYQLWARYLDRFVRTADGWRFCERRLGVAGQSGADNPFPGIGRREPDPALLEKIRARAG